MASTQTLEKNTKYLVLIVFLLLLIGVIFVVYGLISPWVNRIVTYYQNPQVEINEEVLSSSALNNLNQFYHIAYPEEEMGRSDILNWPEVSSSEL